MPTRAELGSLTEQVHDLGGQLHEELVNGDADFGRLRELSSELSRRTESLAATFGQVDELLTAQLGGRRRGSDD